MKAVILCAGEGERLKPLTETIPKPLILIGNNPILYYILSSIPKDVRDVFIVIQDKHLRLFKNFLDNYNFDFKVKIIIQDLNKKGTYFALMVATDFLKKEDKFLVLNGDDIFLKEDIEKIIKMPAPTYGIIFKKLDKRYRTCDLDEKNKKIISFRKQKEEEYNKNIPCFSGVFTLTNNFLSYEPVYYEQGEAGIPHTLFANTSNVSFVILKEWLQINTLEDLKIAQKFIDHQQYLFQ